MPTKRSAIAFARGARAGVRTILMSMAVKTLVVYYLSAYLLNRMFGRRIVGSAPPCRKDARRSCGRIRLAAGVVAVVTTWRTSPLAAFGPQADEKGLSLDVELAPGLPATITSDAQRLQQILRNLISNAVKFTASGGVILRIQPAPAGLEHHVAGLDEARALIAFIVTDTGIGIADDKLEMIFDAFQQADGTTSRKYGGTGLGLSISKELVRMLGGTIRVSSRPGVGSEFTLLLPDQLPGAASTPPPRPVAPPAIQHRTSILTPATDDDDTAASPLEGITVLIIDDDVRNVFALTSALEMHGLDVLYADNGADGIRLLIDNPRIDIVLMDSMMPDLDGNETTRRIHRLPQGENLPVVFLTAKAMPGDRETSLAAGASDYVTKPVDKDRLLAVMASRISRRPKETT